MVLLHLALLSLIPVALAQQNTTYTAGLLQTLLSLGANTLASSAEELNHTAIGQNLLNIILNGMNKLTLFTPMIKHVCTILV